MHVSFGDTYPVPFGSPLVPLVGPPVAPPKIVSHKVKKSYFRCPETSPRQMLSVLPPNSDFQGQEGSKIPNDKFVTVGIPEAETSANLSCF